MSFTFEQCRKFKEWGYPQGDGSLKYRYKYGYKGKEATPFDVGNDRDNIEFFAIPTLDGVMEWIEKYMGGFVPVLYPCSGNWYADRYSTHHRAAPLYDFPDYPIIAQTAHEALYNLAQKVKGVK